MKFQLLDIVGDFLCVFLVDPDRELLESHLPHTGFELRLSGFVVCGHDVGPVIAPSLGLIWVYICSLYQPIKSAL